MRLARIRPALAAVVAAAAVGVVPVVQAVPASASPGDGVVIDWPEQTRIGTETYYRFEAVHRGASTSLRAGWDGVNWSWIAESGPSWVRIPEAGPRHVLVEACDTETCELAAVSPELDVYPEVRVPSFGSMSVMGPRTSWVDVTIAHPAGWDRASSAWEVARTETGPALSSGVSTVARSGRFALRFPAGAGPGNYWVRWVLTVHHPELGDFFSERSTEVGWAPSTTGRFAPARRVIRPGRSTFRGTVRTSTQIRAASAELLRRGRVVRRLPVDLRMFSRQFAVTWSGRVRGEVRPGTYRVRVTWTDLSDNRGRAVRSVRVAPPR